MLIHYRLLISKEKKEKVMQRKFRFYSDPGHGWLKVPLDSLAYLGIIGDISSFSYMRGGFAYLEEDSDLEKFSRAYIKHFGKDFQITDMQQSNRESNIRRYASYDKGLAAIHVLKNIDKLKPGPFKDQVRRQIKDYHNSNPWQSTLDVLRHQGNLVICRVS